MKWYINNDLAMVIERNLAIVGRSSADMGYTPSDHVEGDTAPYPLISDAETTMAIAKVNGVLFGRFHNISYSKHRPKKTVLAYINKKGKGRETSLQRKSGEYEDLNREALQRIVTKHGVDKRDKRVDKDEQKITTHVRYKNVGAIAFEQDVEDYMKERRLYESKKATLLQKHGYDPNAKEGGGYHAEDGFLSAWEEFKKFAIYDELKRLGNGRLHVTLKLSKSPCGECTSRLIKFRNDEEVILRIKAQGIYHEDSSLKKGLSRVNQLLTAGIPVKAWAVEGKVGKRAKTTMGQLHELSCWSVEPEDSEFLQDVKRRLEGRTSEMNQQIGVEEGSLARDYRRAGRWAKSVADPGIAEAGEQIARGTMAPGSLIW
jgi:hypothetical protein